MLGPLLLSPALLVPCSTRSYSAVTDRLPAEFMWSAVRTCARQTSGLVFEVPNYRASLPCAYRPSLVVRLGTQGSLGMSSGQGREH